MGTYNKGILGAFSGKVGPVVGATWRGKEVMRSLPKKSNRLATTFQQQQRSKFTMTTEFLGGVQPVIKRYFGSDSGLKTRRNQAMSYLMKEAIVFTDPNYEWDYTKILISKGDLLGINNGAVTAGTGQNLDFSWTQNQTFRIVIIPGYFSNRSAQQIDFNDYNAVLQAYGINPSSIKKI